MNGAGECNAKSYAGENPLNVSWSRTGMQEMETDVGAGHDRASASGCQL